MTDQVADGIWSIPIPLAQPGNPYSLCYVIDGARGSVHLLDPGSDSEDNCKILRAGLEVVGRQVADVASIFVTHLHSDHIGMADRLRKASGASLVMLAREREALRSLAAGAADIEAHLDRWAVPTNRRAEIRSADSPARSREVIEADLLVEDGDRWQVPGRDLEVLATPGHTPGHACIVDRESEILFSGDHVLPTIYSGIGLGGPSISNPISDYFFSLTRVEQLGDLQVAPGHEFPFRTLAARCTDIREHHLRRSREVARFVNEHPDAAVFEIASRLTWTAGWDNLSGPLVESALRQTEMHRAFVRTSDYSG